MHVSWILTKRMIPFTNMVKECFLIEVASALFDGKKDIIIIIQTIRDTPLFFSSKVRSTEIKGYSDLIRALSATSCYALAVDKSCDNATVYFFTVWDHTRRRLVLRIFRKTSILYEKNLYQ